MHTPGLKKRLLSYLKSNPGVYVHKGTLALKAQEAGFLGETAGRRLRELAEEGMLEVKEEKGSVWYCAPITQLSQRTLA